MNREYVITHRNSEGRVLVTTRHDNPELALDMFQAAMIEAGHEEARVHYHLRVWTVMLMSGSKGCEVHSPDFDGSVSITITPTEAKSMST